MMWQMHMRVVYKATCCSDLQMLAGANWAAMEGHKWHSSWKDGVHRNMLRFPLKLDKWPQPSCSTLHYAHSQSGTRAG